MLDEYRKQIDQIDKAILSLLVKRNQLAIKIGALKRKNNIPIVDKKREEEKLKTLVERGEKHSVSKDFIETIWQIIFKEAYRLEK